MNPSTKSAASVLAMISSMGWQMPFHKEKEEKISKCLLPSCEVQTSHNGGYCCKEHCKQHKELKQK